MANEFRIALKFDTGATHLTADVRRKNPGWADERLNLMGRVESFDFFLPQNIQIHMERFEAYNFFVEASRNLGGGGRGRLEALWFMGKYRDRKGKELVRTYSVRFRDNVITKNVVLFGREYYGTSSRCWRDGLIGARARCAVLQNGKPVA